MIKNNKVKFLTLIITILICGAVFTACISQLPSYSVEFDANGGTGLESSYYEFQNIQTIQDGSTAFDPSEFFYRYDYSLAGWSMNPEGAPLFEFSTPIKSNIKLYAIWEITNLGIIKAAMAKTVDNLTGITIHSTIPISVNDNTTYKFLYEDGQLTAFEYYWGATVDNVWEPSTVHYYKDGMIYAFQNGTLYTSHKIEAAEYYLPYLTPAGLISATPMTFPITEMADLVPTAKGFNSTTYYYDAPYKTISVEMADGFITKIIYHQHGNDLVYTTEFFTNESPFEINMPAH